MLMVSYFLVIIGSGYGLALFDAQQLPPSMLTSLRNGLSKKNFTEIWLKKQTKKTNTMHQAITLNHVDLS